MLAKRFAGILPLMSFAEALETTQVYSVAGLLAQGAGLMSERPFRSPHHTVSDAGLIGGGSGTPRPGEVSLAHNGVLFLDELPEFPRNVLEQLRQPLEEGCVTLARAQMTLSFPAKFMLVAAMNPCQFLSQMRQVKDGAPITNPTGTHQPGEHRGRTGEDSKFHALAAFAGDGFGRNQ
jgi:magnesium chelatase family protein